MIVDNKIYQPYSWTQISDRVIWRYAIMAGLYHIGLIATVCFYASVIAAPATVAPIKFFTIIWAFVVGILSEFGATAGAHRLWTHRSYKANLLLRIILMILYTTMGLNPLYYWIRDHRVHHKYSDTDADPHNSNRGFFYCHFGWMIMKRHPDCIKKSKEIDMSDIDADGVVMFQKKHASVLRLLLCFIIPTVIPVTFWDETILHSVLTQCFLRYVIVMNCVWAVNSFAHLWGYRPYNRQINAVENIGVCLLTSGEGSHNYHHTFPWDYKCSELPYINFNTTTLFIDAFAKIGWAYDRRQPSKEFVKKVIENCG